MAAFQYHDAVCVVAGLTIPAAQQNSFDQVSKLYAYYKVLCNYPKLFNDTVICYDIQSQ